MKKTKTGFNLKTYIDLFELMQKNHSSREENRSFGLAHQKLLSSPVALLSRWVEEHRHRLSHPPLSQTIDSALSTATLILLILAFFLGIFSGVGLLRYSGSEPVNLLYFLGAVFVLPLVTMTMTFLAMLRANRAESILVHLSPAYWMERILLLLPIRNRERFNSIQINPLITNWLVIRRSQELALSFSLGLFLALLGIVASRDIAFSWSTTLQITPEAFHHFLSMIALPWKEILPQAVPSAELIEQSHYFRLGGKLNSGMIDHAALLGEWWKFLAMTTLFYALFLRFLLFLLASAGLKRAFGRAMFSIRGVRDLLREMEEPIIESESPAIEQEFKRNNDPDRVATAALKTDYATVIGWALDKEAIILQNEREGIKPTSIYEAGGLHSLEEDQEVIDVASGDILLYVKSWEPPTMDFIDFLTALNAEESRSIMLYPLGTPEAAYQATKEAFEIWMNKISGLKDHEIRMKR
jgi:hypothetical protein